MKKQGKALLMLALTILMLVSFISCEVLLEILETDVRGSAVNAMADGTDTEYWTDKDGTAGSLEGAVLSFYKKQADGTYSTTATTTTTVTSQGNFYVGALAMGEYKIQGAQDGWIFVPRYVNIAGDDMTVPPVIAYPSQGEDVAVFLVSWTDTDLDLDTYVTYYDGTTRDEVYYGDKTYAVGGTNVLELTRDITRSAPDDIPRVETILVRGVETASFMDATGETTISGIDVPNDRLLFYVKAYSGSLTGLDAGTAGDKPFSGAQFDLMYTDPDGVTAHYGGATAAWNTDEILAQPFYMDASWLDGYDIGTITDNIIRSAF